MTVIFIKLEQQHSTLCTLASFSSDTPSFCRQRCRATQTLSCNFCIFWTSVSQGRSEGNDSDKMASLALSCHQSETASGVGLQCTNIQEQNTKCIKQHMSCAVYLWQSNYDCLYNFQIPLRQPLALKRYGDQFAETRNLSGVGE